MEEFKENMEEQKLNRIILIGNGFDLAHGLKTSYGHFLNYFWETQLEEVNTHVKWKKPPENSDGYYTFENNFISIRFAKDFVDKAAIGKKEEGDDIFFEFNNVNILKNSIEYYNNNFLESIENQYRRLQHWFDVEELYFRQLKNCKDRYKNDRASYEIYTIKQLNKDFRDIKSKLIEYLPKEKHIVIDESFQKKMIKFFTQAPKINVDDAKKDIGEIMFLSCNYIDTESQYIKNGKLITTETEYDAKAIHIHGLIDDTKNCADNVIFGYGDESASESSDIENLNNNEFLENVKSIKYIVSPAYKELLKFIKKAEYDVFIFGHSCGNSDRTLLKELFEAKNCKAIRYFFYTMKDGTDDFEEKTTNIYRSFSDKNKSMFREKMLAFDREDEFSYEKIEPDEGLIISRKKEQDKKNIAVEDKISVYEENVVVNKEKMEQYVSTPKSIEQIINEENMMPIKGGEYSMGSNDNEDETPIHKVILYDFYMCKYLVTQDQWQKLIGTNIRQQRDRGNPDWSLYGEGDKYPMYYVNWYEAVEFCNKLSEKYKLEKYYNIDESEITINSNAKGFRLPTEAEWEYAARGGKWLKEYKYSGSNKLDDVGWYFENSDGKTHEVGKKKKNDLGIYDMSGNVWEWCFDKYGKYDSRSQKNPQGAYTGAVRVLRGCSWHGTAECCTVSYRGYFTPGGRHIGVGFRLVLPQ